MLEEGTFSLSGFLSVLTSIGFAVPMVAKTIEGLTTTFTKDNIIKMSNTLVNFANAKSHDEVGDEALESSAEIALEAKALEELNEQELINLGISKTSNGRFNSNGTRGSQGFHSGKTTVKDFLSTKSGSNGASPIKELGPALGKIALTLLPIVAALAVAGASIGIMVTQFNKHKEQLKEAKDHAKRLNDEYKKAAEAT